jgi:hypothetical protein
MKGEKLEVVRGSENGFRDMEHKNADVEVKIRIQRAEPIEQGVPAAVFDGAY